MAMDLSRCQQPQFVGDRVEAQRQLFRRHGQRKRGQDVALGVDAVDGLRRQQPERHPGVAGDGGQHGRAEVEAAGIRDFQVLNLRELRALYLPRLAGRGFEQPMRGRRVRQRAFLDGFEVTVEDVLTQCVGMMQKQPVAAHVDVDGIDDCSGCEQGDFTITGNEAINALVGSEPESGKDEGAGCGLGSGCGRRWIGIVAGVCVIATALKTGGDQQGR
ncbi:MAG: hypothetical protein PHQ14_01495, partial [Chromatiales bacterium]|nr:hypothetical protein [Chromatiales bacterium]